MIDRIPLRDGEVDLAGRVLVRAGRRTRLTAREVEVLRYLVARQGQVVTRDEIEREVWGLHPDVRSEAATVGMRRLRARLEADPQRPVHLHTVRGVGWVFSTPAPSPTLGPRDNLPPVVEPLLGREEALAAVQEALSGPGRLVALVGPPGAGKSRVARGAAQRMRDADDHLQVWWVPPDGALHATLARALGLPGPAALVEALKARGRTLIIVDEAERRKGLGEALEPLWAAPGVRVLLVSRVRPGLPGERTIWLRPLDEQAGARLLRARVRALSPDFEASEDVLRALSRRLDGLPLALEMAAQWLRFVSPEVLLQRLDLRGAGGALAEAIEESVAQLSPPARAALLRLAAFAGPLAGDTAQRLLEELAPAPERLLGELVDCSLVRQEGRQIVMLSTLRRHLTPQVDDMAVMLHCSIVLQEGETLADGLHRSGGLVAFERLKALQPDLELAASRASASDAARLALILATVERLCGDQEARRRWLEGVDPDALEPALRLRVLAERGRARVMGGRHDAGRRDLQAATQAGPPVAGQAWRGLVLGHLCLGEAEEARALAGEVLRSQALDDTTRVELLGDIGVLSAMTRDFAASQAALLEARETARLAGNDLRMGPLWTITADTLGGGGSMEAALDAAERALEAHRACGARLHEASTLTILGRTESHLGRASAEAHLREAAAMALQLGQPDYTALALDNLAEHLLDLGRLDEADEHGMRAWVLCRPVERCRWAPLIRGNGGLRAWVRGQLPLARLWLREAIALAHASGQRRVGLVFQGCLAGVLAELGEAGPARLALSQARPETTDPVDGAHHALVSGLVLLALEGDAAPAAAALVGLRAPPNPLWGRRADVRILGRLVEQRLGA
ncbi:MAG: winged helix-turn-helix domain-containing protein [Alphaproteobacteria bacterium]|nr:winged helix-turn-helix domain-containing protein [Alphaproteobacteria bacterium]